MLRRITRLVLSALFGIVLVVVAAWAVLPWPLAYRWKDPERTSLMRYRLRQADARGEPIELRHRHVPLNDIAPAVVRAVVAAEDGRFRDHSGIDWQALAEELEYSGEPPFSWADPADWRGLLAAGRFYWKNRDQVRGRSTITQQLAKNLFWDPERSLVRKVGEFVVARRLERFLDKDRILELYLNTVELGPGVFGVEAASREYFDRPASELTTFQAASLAATLPHPLTSNPAHRPGRMAWRRDLILARLGGGGGGDRSPIPVAPEPVAPPPEPELDPVGTVGADTGRTPGDSIPADSPDTAAAPDTAGGPPPDTTALPDTLGLRPG